MRRQTIVGYWPVALVVDEAGWIVTVAALVCPPLLGVVKSGRTLTRSPVVTSVRAAGALFKNVVEPLTRTLT